MYNVLTATRIPSDLAEMQGRADTDAHYSVEVCDEAEFEYAEFVVSIDLECGTAHSCAMVKSVDMFPNEEEARTKATAAALELWRKGE